MKKGTKAFRNEYDRFVLKFLIENYYISRIDLSKAIGLAPSYVREFSNGSRNFGNEALEKLESTVFSLYSPLLDNHSFELEQVTRLIESINSDEELELFRLKGANALEV
ncbi:TPA: helix-turn-helix domain-containing protein [Enterococcus faecium]|uniref:helix-turn-helix domain-containing protein n=1 Tax=Enterococcus TaxID=1350 RepID=UPI001C014B28|nr:helix-turn-helix domain-containing protein [Enterococcus faecium]MBT9709432.1 XRE family transcriptional regulator [Enterococcus faecium]MCZ1826685.1 XRE family transcriptional regulator [Enterococcus faecium]MDT6503603.1 XRE family transcriptional regulator [Enterococcus faecium]MDT6517668.1 XRE family transcriptional regulator [Enterococcus faecium]MDT6580159.1 XRE family transcriptional regulator [Enterococcus faecium]